MRAGLEAAQPHDRSARERIRALLIEAVGESTFEIWLAQLELIAVDRGGTLLIDTHEATRGWVRARFGRVLERCSGRIGRAVRFVEKRERVAVEPRPGDASLPRGEEERPRSHRRTAARIGGLEP